MWTKLLFFLALLSFLRSCQSCRKKKTGQLECLAGTAPLVKNMMSTVKAMQVSLPDDQHHIKLLRNFSRPCKKRGVDLTVVSSILDMYITHVFNKQSNSQTFMDNLSRLADNINHCLDRLCDSKCGLKWSKNRKLEHLRRRFEELDQRGLHKAVGEFKTVLVWITMLMDG